MLESQIERALITEVEKHGAKARKFVSPGWAGAPDRIVLLPGGRVVFVELKTPKTVMRPLQKKRRAELTGLGFSVYEIRSLSEVKKFIAEVFQECDLNHTATRK
ncbi:MAG: VRR-NUC domain-containing protein [Bacillota bacterium]|jgi:hypothetical protein|nr:VRR-NUC domain-containing protein [Bacillota bacterium]